MVSSGQVPNFGSSRYNGDRSTNPKILTRSEHRRESWEISSDMTNRRCICPRCLHATCPPPFAEPPYDEVTHEIDSTFLSVKIPKNKAQIESDDATQLQEKLSFDFNCADAEGEKCKPGCTKVHVIPDRDPPEKKPEEETLSLRAIRQIMPNDDSKNTLEIEFKAPRNYIPLPELGPPPRVIVPKQKIGSRRKGKLKAKRRK